jgi:hypothetical protein
LEQFNTDQKRHCWRLHAHGGPIKPYTPARGARPGRDAYPKLPRQPPQV